MLNEVEKEQTCISHHANKRREKVLIDEGWVILGEASQVHLIIADANDLAEKS